MQPMLLHSDLTEGRAGRTFRAFPLIDSQGNEHKRERNCQFVRSGKEGRWIRCGERPGHQCCQKCALKLCTKPVRMYRVCEEVLNMAVKNFFLLLINCSSWPCMALPGKRTRSCKANLPKRNIYKNNSLNLQSIFFARPCTYLLRTTRYVN